MADDTKSTRLEILEASLKKKQANFDRKIQAHYKDVGMANGQPLNDKRNGQATLDRWEKQNQSLLNAQAEIEKTKEAIERERSKINYSNQALDELPQEILDLLKSGELTQWRKYPNTFFVVGVDKARISWDFKKKIVSCRYVQKIPDAEQHKKFAVLFNGLRQSLNKESKNG